MRRFGIGAIAPVPRVAVTSLIVALVVAANAGVADAQGRRDAAPIPTGSDHQSVLTIPAGGPAPLTRRVTIGRDKSMLVEVPVDLTNVLVSNPGIIDAVVQSPRQVYLLAKDVGEANAFFFGQNGQKVLLLEISVRQDLTMLMETVHRLMPGSRIRAEMMGETVVLSGTVASPVDANRAAELASRFVKSKEKDKVVNLLTTGTKEQVLLQVTVAEMQRDAMRRIGVDISNSSFAKGDLTFAKVIQNAFPVTSPAVAAAAASPAGPLVVAGSALQSQWTSGNQSVTGLMQALERAGLVRTLAEPNLTALSGQTAKFKAGGEFPIPIGLDNGKIAVEWKEFGVIVSFKPVVLSEGKISLTISAEVSEIAQENSISIGGLVLPGLKVRRAETTLELPSGGTLAMAGLLSDDTRQSVEGLPALKNLPVLGALFRSNDYRKRETELVILVTPYLATHAPRKEMATPEQGHMPANELRELFFGRLNRVYGKKDHSRSPARDRYHGDFGFIIEYPDPGVKG